MLLCYRNAGLQLRRDKCKFAFSELEFVGHVVSKEGHKPVSDLIERIRTHSPPHSVRELRSFLGLVNYYQRDNHELSDTDSINDSNSETEGLRSDSDEEHSNSEISERAVPALVPRRSTRVNKGKLPERYSDNLYDFPKEPLEPGSSFRKGEEMS